MKHTTSWSLWKRQFVSVLAVATLITGAWFLAGNGSADSPDCSAGLDTPYIAGKLEVAEQGDETRSSGTQLNKIRPSTCSTVLLKDSSTRPPRKGTISTMASTRQRRDTLSMIRCSRMPPQDRPQQGVMAVSAQIIHRMHVLFAFPTMTITVSRLKEIGLHSQHSSSRKHCDTGSI